MTDSEFGEDINSVELLYSGLVDLSGKGLCSTSMQLWLLESYEKRYGICDYNTPPVPGDEIDPQGMIGIRMHKSEDPLLGGPLEDAITRFAELEIGKYFNISLAEYLNQPRHMNEMLISAAVKLKERDSKVADSLASGLEQLRG